MPQRSAKKKARVNSRSRASWKGNLTFGLVSFTVEAYNAIDRTGSDIHFHQIHAGCHRRIHYEKVCPVHGEVSHDEIVSGYEQAKGHYLEIDPDELDALLTSNERALTIDAFVAPDEIDPLYYDGRMYYLLPSGKAAQAPYELIRTAMLREEVYGIGQVVFSGKDQIALLRVVEGVLHMAMLNFEAEIKPPEKMAEGLSNTKPEARQLKLAQSLIREWSVEDFDFSQYTDSYRERVEKLIQAKAKGQKIEAPEEPDEEPATINLMEALKNSLKAPHGVTSKTPGKRKRKSASSKKHTA